MTLTAPPPVKDPVRRDVEDAVITDAVIKEAKRRARRRRWRYGGVAAVALSILAALVAWDASPTQGPPFGDAAGGGAGSLAAGGVASDGGLGVFEPFRGWIFFADGQGISAIDPEDPSSRRVVLENPEGISSHVTPVGWSADGSKLTLVDEGESGLWVMDSSGSLTHVSGAGGCCIFVYTDPVSPDGTTAIPWQEGLGRAVWSADGTASALTVPDPVGRPHEVHTAAVLITDHESGTTRQLDIPPVEIGHMAWSPDGEWLVLTAPGNQPHYWLATNPADTRGLYVARVDGSGVRRISSGSYLAAAWSPDGTQIAALTSGRELWVMKADGSDPRLILGRAVLPPEWTGIAWQPQASQP